MFVIALLIVMLVSPWVLWYLDYTVLATYWGLYVLFSIPSMYWICAAAIKNRTWPKISGGPSFHFNVRDGKKLFHVGRLK